MLYPSAVSNIKHIRAWYEIDFMCALQYKLKLYFLSVGVMFDRKLSQFQRPTYDVSIKSNVVACLANSFGYGASHPAYTVNGSTS